MADLGAIGTPASRAKSNQQTVTAGNASAHALPAPYGRLGWVAAPWLQGAQASGKVYGGGITFK